MNIHNNPAFIVATFELIQLVSNIQKNTINIDKFVDDLGNDIKHYIIINLMGDDIVLSNDIEGVSSTRKEV